MRAAGEGRGVVVAASLVAAVLAAASCLVPVVIGPGWVVELTATLLLMSAVSVAVARSRAPGWVVPAAQVAVLVEVLTVVHAPAQAVAGLLPGPAAVQHAGVLLEQAMAVVRGQSAPIDATSGVRLAMTAVGGAVLVVSRLLAVSWHRPALVGLPLVAVYGVGGVFAPDGLGVLPFLLTAAGWLLVVLVARPPAPRWGPVVAPLTPLPPRPGLAPLVVAGALVVALVVPATISLPSSPTFFTGSGTGGGATSVNPLLDLRQNLTARSDTVVMTYRTDQRDPQPLRVVTVDSFDGDQWRPTSSGGVQPLPRGGRLAPAPGLAPGTPTANRTMDVTIRTLRQDYLPLPYPVRQVAVDGDWTVDPTTATVTGARGTRTGPGLEYRVDYQQVSPDAAALAAAPPPPPQLVDAYAAVPPTLPATIAETAREVTQAAAATTDYQRAVALQDWFRSTGGFTYDTDLAPPTSPSALADFLTTKRGYCVHFASEMAVMARTLGIPARVAVGFLPGRSTPDGYEVSATDAHAWPELYFEGAGWTRFEPTPTRGTTPGWTQPATTSDGPDPQAPAPSASTAPAPGQQDVPVPAARPDTGGTSPAAAGGTAWTLQRAALGAGGLAVLLALLALPAIARRWRSSRRWRRAVGHDPDGAQGAAAEAAWADLVERLGDLGVGPEVSATPRQVRAAVLERVGGAGGPPPTGSHARGGPDVDAALGDLVSAVEGARYGASSTVSAPAQPLRGLRGEALGVERAVRSTLGRGRSLRARWWPTSGLRALLPGAGRDRRR